MSNYSSLKAVVDASIRTNRNQEITGPIMNSVLKAMINSLGAGYQFMGIATPDTDPGAPDPNIYYFATTPGSYPHFGGVTVGNMALLYYNGTWLKQDFDVASVLTVEALAALVTEEQAAIVPTPLTMHKVGGTNGYWNSLSGAWVSDNTRRGSDKIDVAEGEKYLVTTKIGGSTAIAYVAQWNGDAWVGVAAGFAGGSGNAEDREYVIPSGVTKIAICSYNTTVPTLKKVNTTIVAKAYSKDESDALYAPITLRGIKKYGVKWSVSNFEDLGARCFDAVGLTAAIGVGNTDGHSDFDSVYPWSEMRRCNIKINAAGAKIVTFEGETGFSMDGSNGDVFVRVPKFYVEKYIKDGYEYRTVSEIGTTVHPAFIEDGKELDEIFIAAFEGVVESNKLRSKAGVIPANNETPQAFLDAAQENGGNYSLYDMRCVDALWTLMAVEYGCRNSNQIIGWGYSDYEQPFDNTYNGISLAATNTNSVQIGVAHDNSKRIEMLTNFRAGNNLTICEGTQENVIAQRKITDVVCAAVGDHCVITFDGSPIDVNTSMFVGNAACDTNYCETIGDAYKLNWHTGYTNKAPLGGIGKLTETTNPCRYRWIENPVGNLWHNLPDITFNDGQMYVCDNMKDYEFHKTASPYRPVGGILPYQTSNGSKSDVNTSANPNFWMTSLLNDIFVKGNCFPKSFDTLHDGTITAKKGFGGYYYLYNGKKSIANGGGFDHLWRSNVLTNRAWISSGQKWFLYGARLMYKNID